MNAFGKLRLRDLGLFSCVKKYLGGIELVGLLVKLCPFGRTFLPVFPCQHGTIVIYLAIVCLHNYRYIPYVTHKALHARIL